MYVTCSRDGQLADENSGNKNEGVSMSSYWLMQMHQHRLDVTEDSHTQCSSPQLSSLQDGLTRCRPIWRPTIWKRVQTWLLDVKHRLTSVSKDANSFLKYLLEYSESREKEMKCWLFAPENSRQVGPNVFGLIWG